MFRSSTLDRQTTAFGRSHCQTPYRKREGNTIA
jgi:hypothetical protein